MPIALGKATRIVQVLLKTGKEYVAVMHLHKEVPVPEIQRIKEQFVGKIKQKPPVRSAVKRNERIRRVYYLSILEIEGKDVLFKIGCEAGTYIRKFVHDVGQELKCGAHLKELVRTKVAGFNDQNWHTLQDLKDAYEFHKEGNDKELRKILLPIESGISHLPKVYVLDTTVDTLCHGANLSIPGISKLDSNIKVNEDIAVLSLKNELVCIGKAMLDSDEIIKNEKGLAVNTSKVFMAPNTYKKFIKVDRS